MSTKLKVILAIVFCIFYVPGYFFLLPQIGNPNYDLIGIIVGSLFTLFGLFGHSVLLFEKRYAQFENNKRQIFKAKFFFKVLGTIIALFLGILLIGGGLFDQADNIEQSDLRFIKGTLKEKPKFRKGAKSSTSLNIYINEQPNFTFEAMYDEYLHYNTSLETDCNIGDTITLGILKDDFDKNISETMKKTYADKHINQHLIMFYYLESNSVVYLDANTHNLLDEDDKRWGPFVAFFGILPLLSILSIWSTELINFFRRKGYTKIADKLEKYKRKKIL